MGLLLAVALVQAPAPEPVESSSAVVYLADGSSLPLSDWTLTYATVECGGDPAHRVTRVEFPPGEGVR